MSMVQGRKRAMPQHVVLLQAQRLLDSRHLLHKHVDTDVSWQRAPVLARQEGVPAPNLKPQRPVSFWISPSSTTAFTALASAMTLAKILGTASSPATEGCMRSAGPGSWDLSQVKQRRELGMAAREGQWRGEQGCAWS